MYRSLDPRDKTMVREGDTRVGNYTKRKHKANTRKHCIEATWKNITGEIIVTHLTMKDKTLGALNLYL